MEKLCLWIGLTSDYRTGRKLILKNDSEDVDISALEEYHNTGFHKIELSISANKTLYILGVNYDCKKIIYQEESKSEEKLQQSALKFFSEINECLPFVVEGDLTSGYKENGHYPEIPPTIKKRKSIVNKNFDKYDYEFICAVIIDEDGDVFEELLINPLF